jgi:hypothetical protein
MASTDREGLGRGRASSPADLVREIRTYAASCHCGAVRFQVRSEEITTGLRCNCSICVRKGGVMSARYFAPDEVEELQGTDSLAVYRFGDRGIDHCFCRICGISPFSIVKAVPEGYDGPARPGSYRVNLGCVHGLDVLALDVSVIDGRSF